MAAFLAVAWLPQTARLAPVAWAAPTIAQCDLAAEVKHQLRMRAKRFVQRRADLPLSFGLEAEFKLSECPTLVDYYRPPDVSESNWRALTEVERQSIAEQRIAFRARVGGGRDGLVRLSTAPESFPAQLAVEISGNVEMNGMVFETLNDARAFADDVATRIGPASWQGHVAYPVTAVPGTAGYVVFEADLAQLQALERGHARYLADPAQVPAKNLTHHSLGPLGEFDRRKLKWGEEAAARGATPGELGTTRTVSAPVFRSDPYPKGLVGHELRQFHKRYDEMFDSMDHLAANLESPKTLEGFKEFADAPLIGPDLPFDRAEAMRFPVDRAAWEGFFTRIGEQIEPGRYRRASYGGAPLNQRFFYPFRDWYDHPILATLPEAEREAARTRIVQATYRYLGDLNRLVKTGKVDAEVLRELQILSARWGAQADLSKYFADYKRAQAGAPFERRAVALTARSALPLGAELSGRREEVFAITQKPVGRVHLTPSVIASPAYADYLRESVEVIYSPVAPFGHINLRVGDRYYGFESVGMTRNAEFVPPIGRTGRRGAAFKLAPEEIDEMNAELERLYSSCARANLPPFDGYSPLLELLGDAESGWRVNSDSPSFANRGAIKARLVERDGMSLLRAANGFEYPLIERAGKRYVQSLSCSSSATHVLQTFFGIEVPAGAAAKGLIEALERGNPRGRAPDLLLDYKP